MGTRTPLGTRRWRAWASRAWNWPLGLCALGLALGLALGPAPEAAASTSAAGSARSHRVRRGETLGGIAHRFGCRVDRLRRDNHLRGDLIRVGQQLSLAACRAGRSSGRGAPSPSRPAATSDGLNVRPNGKPDVGPNVGPNASLVEHIVGRGDTLGRIAKRYGTTLSALRKDNHLGRRRGDLIRVGQRLWVRATLPSRKRRRFVYTIQPGDTLSGIARRFHTTWAEIGRVNRLRDPNRLRVGDRIELYREGPAVASSTVGRPQHGRLEHGEQLPPGPGYRRRHPKRAWGTNETVTQLLRAIAAVRRQFPRRHDLLIGDLSAEHGGPIRPHVSHQSGRDVDVGFFFRGAPRRGTPYFWRLKRNRDRIDFPASWAWIQALVGPDEAHSPVDHIYLGYDEQKLFYDWAKAHGVSQARLSFVFQYPRGRRVLRGKLRHWPGHVGHMHVRFKCPPEDKACVR